MQRVFRFTLAGALAIAGLTACGSSKEAPPSQVTAVSVTPQSVPSMNVGDKVTFVATVTADPSVTDRAVTWSSSNAAVATVDQNGTATAVAGGTASIIATSHFTPSVQGAAVVTVNAFVQPSVTIQSFNHTVAGTGSVPVDQSNVFGQLDVLLNVDAGTEKLSTVSLIATVNGKDTTVATGNVSDKAPAVSEAASTVTLSFNTAAFNPTTGVVAFKNGPVGIKASVVTSSGTITTSTSQTLTFNNRDTVVVSPLSTTPSTGQNAQATDGGGLSWRAGAVNASAVAAIYTPGRSIVSGTFTLFNLNANSQLGKNKAVITTGSSWATLANVSDSTGTMSASFPNSTSASNGAAVGGAQMNGVGVSVTTIDNAGNNGPSTAQVPSNTIRLDNLAPDTTGVTFVANTQNSVNGWVGKAFVFSVGAGSLTLGNAASDVTLGVPGVDNVVDTTQLTASPAGSGSTFTNFSAVTSLPETSTGSANTLRLKLCDALGNCSFSSNLGTFGVDLTPPTLSFTSGPKDQQVFNFASTLFTTATFDVSDSSATAGVTASGAGTNALLVTVQGLHPSGASSSQTKCDVGNPTGSAPAVTCKSAVPQQRTFNLPTIAGEYTMTVQGVDQAGNTSAPMTTHFYIDQNSPVVSGGVAVPASITTGTQFASSATDSMDVAAGNGYLGYTGLAAKFVEGGTGSPTGVVFDNALTRSSNIVVTLNVFYRSLSNVIDVAGIKPDSVGIRAVDAAGNLAVHQGVGLPAANIASGTTFTHTDTLVGITTFTVASAPANPVDSGSTVTLTATANAASATTGSPFTQVCFYQQASTGNEGQAAGVGGAATGELVLIGCSSAETTTLGPRALNYSVPFTTPNVGAQNITVIAIGNNAGGDGLASNAIVVHTKP